MVLAIDQTDKTPPHTMGRGLLFGLEATTGATVNEAPNTAFLAGKHFSHNMQMHAVTPS